MVVTGELIRLMNYVDEISATLRRINAQIPTMTEEEKHRLAEYIRKAQPGVQDILQRLDSSK